MDTLYRVKYSGLRELPLSSTPHRPHADAAPGCQFSACIDTSSPPYILLVLMQAPSIRLRHLQEELDTLKIYYGKRLRLRRERAAGLPEPFKSITAALKLELPAAAALYDVSTIVVQLEILALSIKDNLSASDRATGVQIEFTADLPPPLCRHIADLLHTQWSQQLQTRIDEHTLALGSIFQHAEGELVALLTSDGSFLEPYQSVDAAGATVRRHTFVDPSAASAELEQHVAANDPADVRSAAATTKQHASGIHASPSDEASQHACLPSFAAGTPAAAEQTYLQRRFGPVFRQHPNAPTKPALQFATQSPPKSPAAGGHEPRQQAVHFELQLQPTDASWDSTAQLRLRGRLHASYAEAGSWALQILPNSMVSTKQAQLMMRLAEHAGSGKGAASPIRAILRHLENRAGLLAQEAQDIVMEAERRRKLTQPGTASQSTAAADALPAFSAATASSAHAQQASIAPDLADMGLGTPQADLSDSAAGYSSFDSTCMDHTGDSSSHSDSEDSRTETEDEDQDNRDVSGGTDGEQADEGRGSAAQQRGESIRDALDLTLLDLKLDNLDALEPYNLVLQVACSRCGKCQDVASDLAGGSARHTRASLELSCSECHQPWRLDIFARLVHAGSNVLARMRPYGCNPIDLLPSLMAGQCSHCSSIAAFRQVHTGRPNERACSRCHTPLSFSFPAAAYISAQQSSPVSRGSTRSKAREARSRGGSDTAIQPGQPLPGTGTCRHYHHSHRWLRFPCCGHRFPCDLCHEEQMDGHEMKWATRMVCGYCSTEQALGERCRVCEKKLARSTATQAGRPTRFWEGGKGCRDPKRMDRHDPRRYRNSRNKTRSKKSSRVGQEGASKHRPTTAA